MLASRLGLLLWLFLLHGVGIYLFAKGFFQPRLPFSNTSTCVKTNCGVRPTHKRAVLLIIDSLRFDFIAPNPPTPQSPFHHSVLTLPSELTAKYPDRSFIFNAYADPPTITLQRIKSIMTGSLPTFGDVANSFGGSPIAEDSFLSQLKRAGKKLAFMGDNTWTSVFPDAFEPNMTFAYDPFNADDLHTVDNGVIEHLFPLLSDPSHPFDLLIGHFLGVDHAGHRVGSDHPRMKAKLEEMNEVLTRIVQRLEEDTLLVVLGDHGMDRSGNHGGDSILETSSAMWVYSHSTPLSDLSSNPPPALLQFANFPGSETPYRSVQQIDILPTLSLLLGVPIPYSNLGSVIPELFWRISWDGKRVLDLALQANAEQIQEYLETYRSSAITGGELDEAWPNLQTGFRGIHTAAISTDPRSLTSIDFNDFNRLALATCRAVWTQFNPLFMGLGLLVMGTSLCASWIIYAGLADLKNPFDAWMKRVLRLALRGTGGGAFVGLAVCSYFSDFMPGFNVFDKGLLFAALSSSGSVIISSSPKITTDSLKRPPIIIFLHSLALLSKSFTIWEDRLVLILLITSIAPYLFTGFSTPSKRLRNQILGYSLLFAVCVRLMAFSTVCREEQYPFCDVTFFVSASEQLSPEIMRYLAVPVAVLLPWVANQFLEVPGADPSMAKTRYFVFLGPVLVASAVGWVIEWADSALVLGNGWSAALREARSWIGRAAFLWICLGGGVYWYYLNAQTRPSTGFTGKEEETQARSRMVRHRHGADSIGTSYLFFWNLFFGLVYMSMQLTGQVVLALSLISLLSFFNLQLRVSEAHHLQASLSSSLNTSPTPIKPTYTTFKAVLPIALLGFHALYTTGHQTTISSIQLKAAFVLSADVSYPWSFICLVLNSSGPMFLFGLAAPLSVFWKRPYTCMPQNEGQHTDLTDKSDIEDEQIKCETMLAALAVTVYHLAVVFGAAAGSLISRQSPMLWKVSGPRFITAVLQLLTVDSAVIIGIVMCTEREIGRGSERRKDIAVVGTK
ncbi:hypothetical protein GALMADRAFT_77322 [Galerina marginata CBS 339.88]|uniref:Uncharacterized protein n=1 Tax=Galerina marginata (strain CBS 339.88) TaxID=685588 RepID=A0A067SF58_GALM3|nr:hypothetical protein GALMADRAFT_77322 [Galerina marginata CBS 339.88]